MSDIKDRPDNKPINPLDDIGAKDDFDLDLRSIHSNVPREFPQQGLIERLSEDKKFTSRAVSQHKPKAKPKTFTLYPDDINVLKNTRKEYMEYTGCEIEDLPGNSDIVRAALRLFNQISKEERLNFVLENSKYNK